MHNFIKVKIEGKNINNYLKWLIKNKISIHKLKKDGKNILYIVIDSKEYSNLKKYSQNYQINILKYYGTRKYLNFIKKNIIIFISMIISIIVIFIMSKMIFSIDIVYNDQEIVKLLNKELSNHNIKKYKFKKNYDELEKIKKDILDNNKEKLEWLEIVESGTKYIVKLVERKKETEQKKYGYRSIIASKSAIITSIKSFEGEKVKEINDYVKKGDVIISGILEKPTGEFIYKNAVGKVYGEVWYNLDIDYPLYYKEEYVTGNTKKGYVLNFLNKRIPLFGYSSYHNFQKNDNIVFESNIIPVNLVREKQYETIIKEEIYMVETATNQAIKYAKEKLLKNNNKIVEIKSVVVLDKKVKESTISVKLFVSVVEDISKIVEIDIYN